MSATTADPARDGPEGPVRRIVIVGGGTAGWLSAVFLARALRTGDPDGVAVTLVESTDIGTVGVGEATVPTLRNTLAFCGIDEADWMRACNAGFKLAIRFVDWAEQPFWHPFGPAPELGGLPLSQHWLAGRLAGTAPPFAEACFPAVALCAAGRSPKGPDAEPYAGEVGYAYHLDAGLLAQYLAGVGRARGVRHVVDTVTGVARTPDGRIASVGTREHGPLEGDLFLDCSGFRGLLINDVLGEPFVPYSDVLLCDRAIAMPLPTADERDGIEPYTRSTALDAGWVWRTPLYGRSGNGYVYSSAFRTDDEAEREFRAHLGPQAAGVPARRLHMRVGHTRNAWVHNCVAIGLAGGFIEPLESTGIWFIEQALHNLLRHFPARRPEPPVVAHFNAVLRGHYERVRDFIVLHYCTTRRSSPFWAANRATPLPDSLAGALELWSATLPAYDRIVDPGFFKDLSVISILDGMDRLPARAAPLVGHLDPVRARDAFAGLRNRARELVHTLPDHHAQLAGMHAGAHP